MDRIEKLLSFINPSGQGIEIGPSHAPIAPKSGGYKVQIIDHLDQEGLRQKYAAHNVDLRKIEPVDFVWRGEPYAELVGKSKHCDWVIASHVIEHAPDLVGFLNECANLLTDSGVLALAIPDKRYCFDHFRPISSLSQIIDHHRQRRTNHSPGCVAEYYLNAISLSGKIGWGAKDTGRIEFIHGYETARSEMTKVESAAELVDIHAWCFTPSSFRLLIHDLNQLGLIGLSENDFFATEGCEFMVALAKDSQRRAVPRSDLLRNVQEELAESKPL